MNNHLFYNYIVDYKDRCGKDYYNVYKIPTFSVTDEQDGAKRIKAYLISEGHTPKIIVSVKGNYTLAQLQQLAEGKMFPQKVIADSIKKAPIEFM